ncbi:MAG: ABC transporter ATP-binding protein [Patescibacteria group bacterium]|nr:ABC transporter ATP-binding protein [Patescibacteria group bacterium]
MSLIELENIKKLYFERKSNQFAALNGVSLKVAKGEMLAVMGVSGSGKSTLMNIIGCLDKPTSGVYKFEEKEIENLGKAQLVKIRRNKIGFIFQNFNILPRMPAVSNVELPLVYRGIRPQERRAKAKKMMEKVGLGDKVRHKPNMLSGGELQRVAIARALVNDPAIILADEPTGNLDSKSGQQIMNILEELNQQGTTILIVTHDKEIASQAQKIIKIKDGQIV